MRKSLGEESYAIRFTPRKKGSTWSAVNVKRAGELIELGWMRPAGLEVFEERDQPKTAQYSYERQTVRLEGEYETRLRANPKAWDFFQAQSSSYRKAAIWWVLSPKKEETRLRRLETLIEDSANNRKIALLRRGK